MSGLVEVFDDALSGLTPRQIVAELDKYIVGQEEAKRSVAIALRNRMRRQLVHGEIREEIFTLDIPSNAEGDIILKAVATYLRYPPSFAKRLNQEEPEPVEIARATATIAPINS